MRQCWKIRYVFKSHISLRGIFMKKLELCLYVLFIPYIFLKNVFHFCCIGPSVAKETVIGRTKLLVNNCLPSARPREGTCQNLYRVWAESASVHSQERNEGLVRYHLREGHADGVLPPTSHCPASRNHAVASRCPHPDPRRSLRPPHDHWHFLA